MRIEDMPKHIGHFPPADAITFEGEALIVSWSQVQLSRKNGEMRLRHTVVATDKGGPGRLAKWWHRWEVPLNVIETPWATESLRQRAKNARYRA